LIARVGLDMVDVGRIEKAMRRPGFRERILTPEERVLCTTPARVAGRWAAKEAIAKAVGIFLTWHQVEILNDDTRAPIAVIHSSKFDPRRYRIHLSITHEKSIASAVAILETINSRRT
jgi:holo-[acyl-carrier protein] synthase